MDLAAPRTSVTNVPRTLWSEDMQGAVILWHRGHFALCLYLLPCLSYMVPQFSYSVWVQLSSRCPRSPAVCLCSEENLSLPLFFSLLRWRLDTAAHIPVLLLSDLRCSSPSRRVELSYITSVLTLALFGSSFQVLSLFESLVGKTRCYLWEKKSCKTVPIPLTHDTLTHTKRKKKGFYQLEWTYFSRHLCFHILCVSI